MKNYCFNNLEVYLKTNYKIIISLSIILIIIISILFYVCINFRITKNESVSANIDSSSSNTIIKYYTQDDKIPKIVKINDKNYNVIESQISLLEDSVYEIIIKINEAVYVDNEIREISLIYEEERLVKKIIEIVKEM